MKNTTQECFEQVVDTLNERYAKYCEIVGREFRKQPWVARTITYDELYSAVSAEVADLDAKVDAYIQELKQDKTIDEIPVKCPDCGSKYITYSGTGTEQVEEYVRSMYPDRRTDRLDMDTAKSRRQKMRSSGRASLLRQITQPTPG